MRRITSERGRPSAEAASRSGLGTSASMSSVVRSTTGITITASARQPAIEAEFTAYLKNAPEDAWAYYHYGVIQYTRAQAEHRGDCPEAVADLNHALRLNPNLAEAHYELGLIALSQGRLDQGIASLEKAVSLNPQLASAHYRLGLAYQRAGNTARAKAELDLFRALKSEAPYRARVLESLSTMGR